jgi:outer membrane lipoprotein-sorting protein
MKNALVPAALLFGLAALAQTAGEPADPAADVLERLAAQRAGIETLTAPFELANQSGTDLTEDTGTFVFQAPERLLFSLDDPEGEGKDMEYLLDGGRFYEHDLVTQQVQIYDYGEGSRMGVLMTAFRRDITRLTEQFDVSIFDPGDYEDEAAIGLLLEPKPGKEEPPFQRARLYLRAEDSLPVMVYVLHNSQSEMFIRFSEYTKNEPLAPHQAQIAAAKNTVIIENEETFTTVEEEVRYLPAEEAAQDSPAG